jgi:hypothetical protein
MRDLSPKRRELIRPILDQPRQYVLMSVRKLAAAVGSDAMAVLRAIRGMGLESFHLQAPEPLRIRHVLQRDAAAGELLVLPRQGSAPPDR